MERELKFALPDRQAYDALAAVFGPELGQLEQTNHYFDNIDGVVSAGDSSAVRIRCEGELAGPVSWELTYKHGKRRDGAYFQAEELNHALTAAQARLLLAGGDWTPDIWQSQPMAAFAEHYGVRPMRMLGKMHNLRRRYALGDETIELDKTDFPDGSIDYEVEVETEHPEAVAVALQELAERAGTVLRPQTVTKFGRFLARSLGSR